MMTVEELIEKYQLIPHPEGGYFRETYRSDGVIPHSALPGNFKGDRNYCTGIYFLLPQGTKSCLHRIQSDEMWHFYLGGFHDFNFNSRRLWRAENYSGF
ncbi:MAG: cupin domain-containing protein [Planktothrix sp. GU0601_MAG3]|nr:MAG: cupin domain-containing protein [Planktothrix sp. GU0601_MAG3]